MDETKDIYLPLRIDHEDSVEYQVLKQDKEDPDMLIPVLTIFENSSVDSELMCKKVTELLNQEVEKQYNG